MQIFFTASYYGKKEYQKHYDMVLDALENQNVTVISPEKGNYFQSLTQKQLRSLPHQQDRHYFAIKKGIEQADAVVLEISHPDFQVGFEAAYAVESKKYVLALSTHENFSLKIKHPYFKAAQYSEVTIDNIVEDFIKFANRHHYSERFNFFLSPAQLDWLQKEAEKEGLNQSEYLRKLLDGKRLPI